MKISKLLFMLNLILLSINIYSAEIRKKQLQAIRQNELLDAINKGYTDDAIALLDEGATIDDNIMKALLPKPIDSEIVKTITSWLDLNKRRPISEKIDVMAPIQELE